MASWPASWTCFYCSNFINRNGSHVFATIRHHYAKGGDRVSNRRFHRPCFDRFRGHGRPYNPATEYEVLGHEYVA